MTPKKQTPAAKGETLPWRALLRHVLIGWKPEFGERVMAAGKAVEHAFAAVEAELAETKARVRERATGEAEAMAALKDEADRRMNAEARAAKLEAENAKLLRFWNEWHGEKPAPAAAKGETLCCPGYEGSHIIRVHKKLASLEAELAEQKGVNGMMAALAVTLSKDTVAMALKEVEARAAKLEAALALQARDKDRILETVRVALRELEKEEWSDARQRLETLLGGSYLEPAPAAAKPEEK